MRENCKNAAREFHLYTWGYQLSIAKHFCGMYYYFQGFYKLDLASYNFQKKNSDLFQLARVADKRSDVVIGKCLHVQQIEGSYWLMFLPSSLKISILCEVFKQCALLILHDVWREVDYNGYKINTSIHHSTRWPGNLIYSSDLMSLLLVNVEILTMKTTPL